MTFRPLASSSAGCAYVLSGTGLPPVLLDAGVSVSTLRARCGFPLSDLGGCLVTHAHQDHCKCAAQLMKIGVPVYATEPTLRDCGIEGSPFAVALKIGAVTDVAGWKVVAVPAEHDADGTVGFHVDGAGGRLVYLTDTAFSRLKFRGVTHWAVEANFDKEILRDKLKNGNMNAGRYVRTHQTHMSIDRTIRLLQANDLSKAREVWLLHLSDENSDEAKFKDLVQRATGVPTYVAPKTAFGPLETVG